MEKTIGFLQGRRKNETTLEGASAKHKETTKEKQNDQGKGKPGATTTTDAISLHQQQVKHTTTFFCQPPT